MSNSIAPGSSADVNVRVTALTTNPNVPAQYKTVILKKNLVNGVNTLTQEMMSAANTKYVIKYDYALGENITVPANCVLEFDGGSLTNGVVNFNNAIIIGKNFIDDGLNILGEFEVYAEWYKTNNLNSIINTISVREGIITNEKIDAVLYLDAANYEVTSDLHFGNIMIIGKDKYLSIIRLINGCLYNTSHYACIIKNVGIVMDTVNESQYFIHIDKRGTSQSICRRIELDNINILYGTSNENMKAPNSYGSPAPTKTGIYIDTQMYVYDFTISNIFISKLKKGIDFSNSGVYDSNTWMTEGRLKDIQVIGCYIGIDLANCQSMYIDGYVNIMRDDLKDTHDRNIALRLTHATRTSITNMLTFADVSDVYAIAMQSDDISIGTQIFGGQIEGEIISPNYFKNTNFQFNWISRSKASERIWHIIPFNSNNKRLPIGLGTIAYTQEEDGILYRPISKGNNLNINITNIISRYQPFTFCFYFKGDATGNFVVSRIINYTDSTKDEVYGVFRIDVGEWRFRPFIIKNPNPDKEISSVVLSFRNNTEGTGNYVYLDLTHIRFFKGETIGSFNVDDVEQNVHVFTSNKPTDIGIGYCCFDDTLGKPVYAKSIEGDFVTWVDATGSKFKETVDFSQITPNDLVASGQNRWAVYQQLNSKFVPVTLERAVSVYNNKTVNTCVFFTKGATPVLNLAVDYATGSTQTIVEPGVTVELRVPSDAVYLYVQTSTSDGTDSTPEVKICI